MTTPAPVRLYDSLRRDKVAFEPLKAGQVGMYVCGPTPYAPAHIGHAFSAISFDTIRRSLTFLGYQVRYVRNVTDVEDKIIKAANERGEDPMALAARYAVRSGGWVAAPEKDLATVMTERFGHDRGYIGNQYGLGD